MIKELENTLLKKIADNFPEALIVFNAVSDEILFVNNLFQKLWNINNPPDLSLSIINNTIKKSVDFSKYSGDPDSFNIKTLSDGILYTINSSSIEIETSSLLPECPAIMVQKHNVVVVGNLNYQIPPTVFKQIYLMLNTIPIPIFFKDSGGRYSGINKAFEKFVGRKRENILSKTPEEIFPDNNMSLYKEMDGALLKNPGEIAREVSLKISETDTRQVIIHKATYYDQNGKVDGIVGLIFDITEQTKARNLLMESETKLKEINATKDKFFSILAHDLKNPFSVLLGITSFLTENFEDFTKAELLESLYRLNSSSEHLFRLFENLLEWSSLQRGSVHFEPKRLNLRTIATISLYPLMITAAAKNISISNKIDDKFEIYADEKMLEATFRNLTANAIKYTNEYGQIELTARRLDDYNVEISVTDNGIGIENELMKNLFKIENKFSTPGTKNEQGTGLGLILCKEFIEKNGGTLQVESEIEHGSKFKFTVPTAIMN